MKNFDRNFLNNKIKLLAGIDEAGRGPLAGPVVAAAVIFDESTEIEGINDSKKLCESKREELYEKIISQCLCYSVNIIDVDKIDEINILQSTLLAMKNSLNSLSKNPDLVLVDGNQKFNTQIPLQTIVKGDGKSFCIAAASILAKVTRDRIMIKLHEEFPEYNWIKNKGYGTKDHINAIRKSGITPHHRRSFLTKIIEQ